MSRRIYAARGCIAGISPMANSSFSVGTWFAHYLTAMTFRYDLTNPDTFEKDLADLQAKHQDMVKKNKFFLFVSAEVDKETGKPWCPDCVDGIQTSVLKRLTV